LDEDGAALAIWRRVAHLVQASHGRPPLRIGIRWKGGSILLSS
jgi:hypothetical protein